MLGWRDTPIDANAIGRIARASQPYIEQIFVRHAPGMDQDALERKLYVIRKRAKPKRSAIPKSTTGNFFLHPLTLLAHDRIQGAPAGAANIQLLS